MKRLAFILLALAWKAVVLQGAEPVPIYQQFQVLSSLPWLEPGGTRKEILARIYREPEWLVRREVLREYLRTVLPVAEFPSAFSEIMVLDQADFPDVVAAVVMYEWAKRDPAAAARHCEGLFDLVIEAKNSSFERWKYAIEVGDLERLRASSYWFLSRDALHACWLGLDQAPKEVRETFKASYLQRFKAGQADGRLTELGERWLRRYPWNVPTSTPEFENVEAYREYYLEMMRTPSGEIPQKIRWPQEAWDDLVFPRVLVRWMSGDPSRAGQIIEHVLDAYDPKQVYRSDWDPELLAQAIPTEFFVEWVKLDPAGFTAWAKDRQIGWRAEAVYRAAQKSEGRSQYRHEDDARKLWATLDPDSALPTLRQWREVPLIHETLSDLARSGPAGNYWRAQIDRFDSKASLIDDSISSDVVSTWITIDFRGMLQRYSLPHCRQSTVSREYMASILTNRKPLPNNDGVESALSALRLWATVRPEEMRAWIETGGFEPKLREALIWVLEHAEGGFPLPGSPE